MIIFAICLLSNILSSMQTFSIHPQTNAASFIYVFRAFSPSANYANLQREWKEETWQKWTSFWIFCTSSNAKIEKSRGMCRKISAFLTSELEFYRFFAKIFCPWNINSWIFDSNFRKMRTQFLNSDIPRLNKLHYWISFFFSHEVIFQLSFRVWNRYV